MLNMLGLALRTLLAVCVTAVAVWLYVSERNTAFWGFMLAMMLLAFVFAAQLRRFNERGTLKDPDAVFRSPPGYHYCWGTEVKENGARKLEHYVVSVLFDLPYGFELTLKTQWDKPRTVIDSYPPDVAGYFFKRHVEFMPKAPTQAVGTVWQHELRRELLTEICVLLGEIPNSAAGTLTAHSNRLVFRWSRVIMQADPGSKIDAELAHANARLERLSKTLASKEEYFSPVTVPEEETLEPEIVVQQWQMVR